MQHSPCTQDILKRRDQRLLEEPEEAEPEEAQAKPQGGRACSGRGRGGRGRGGRGRGGRSAMKRPAAAKRTSAPPGESGQPDPESAPSKPRPKRKPKAPDADADTGAEGDHTKSNAPDASASKEPPKKKSRGSQAASADQDVPARKTFAKRSYPPKEGPGREKWVALREVFESQLAQKFRFPTKYEDCYRNLGFQAFRNAVLRFSVPNTSLYMCSCRTSSGSSSRRGPVATRH